MEITNKYKLSQMACYVQRSFKSEIVIYTIKDKGMLTKNEFVQ